MVDPSPNRAVVGRADGRHDEKQLFEIDVFVLTDAVTIVEIYDDNEVGGCSKKKELLTNAVKIGEWIGFSIPDSDSSIDNRLYGTLFVCVV